LFLTGKAPGAASNMPEAAAAAEAVAAEVAEAAAEAAAAEAAAAEAAAAEAAAAAVAEAAAVAAVCRTELAGRGARLEHSPIRLHARRYGRV
jgi:hypothetical protein